MKKEYAHDLTEDLLNIDDPNIVIELQNGQRLSTTNYFHDVSENNKTIIVIKTGRKLKKTMLN